VPPGATYELITVTSDSLTASSNRPFLVTFSGGDGTFSQSSFSSELILTGAACPNQIQLSDLDGDNKPDIAYTNSCEDGLSVSRNTTIGSAISFEPAINIITGSAPYGLVVYDLNGDGKKEIVIANFRSNSVSVFKNTSSTGTISFAAKKDYTAGESTYGVTVADLNKDGKPDIIATNEYDNPGTISVFLNTSTKDVLSFAEKQTFTVGYSPRRIITCNINNDHKPDLVVANQGSGAVTVLINTSTLNSISFITHEYSTTPGSNPESISCGDLNGDGKNDLVVSNNNEIGTVSILKNTSVNETVSFTLQSDLPTMEYPYSTVITDLNGDGMPDIAVASHYTSTQVSVYKNISASGNIAFDLPANYSTVAMHECVLAGDLNGDDKPDILLQNDLSNSQLFSVLTNIQGSVLAISLFNFKVSEINNKVLLQWQSDNNTGLSYFIIERSLDALIFNKISKVDAHVNNSGLSTNYSFTDNDAFYLNKNDIVYYRLKEYNKDGSFNYSNVVSIRLNNLSIGVFPNPVNNILNVTGLKTSEIYDVQIVDEKGNIVAKQVIKNSATYKWNVTSLSKGVYFMKIISGRAQSIVKFEK
jgi:hypothetical protein